MGDEVGSPELVRKVLRIGLRSRNNDARLALLLPIVSGSKFAKVGLRDPDLTMY